MPKNTTNEKLATYLHTIPERQAGKLWLKRDIVARASSALYSQ